MKKGIIIILALTFVVCGIKAQQLPNFRGTYLNLLHKNPAYIASSDAPNILINHRSQWVGFTGNPKISSLTAKYNFRPDMAAGLFITNDITGISRKMELSANYSYLLKAELFDIAFGLAWTFTQYKVMGTDITLYEENDQTVNMHLDDKTWKPDANAGIVIFNQNFSAGIGISQLFQTKFIFFDENDIPGTIQSKRHFFLTGSYNFYSHNKDHRFAPYLSGFYVNGAPLKVDAGVRYTGNSGFLGSLSYSHKDAVVLSAGYIYENFYFEYSFDIVTSRIRNFSSGAHEVSLGMFIINHEKTSTKDQFRPMF
jgi:type IX secretion system PorP/SprF family membrane protein